MKLCNDALDLKKEAFTCVRESFFFELRARSDRAKHRINSSLSKRGEVAIIFFDIYKGTDSTNVNVSNEF
jgi:hypothetical protein